MKRPRHLLDVNVLIALAEPDHVHHAVAVEWFATPGLDWGLCTFSEAGFLRASINPRLGNHSIEEATTVLEHLARRPGYRFWPMSHNWAELAVPLRSRVYGHQQITDAYLLGMAIKENGILVTFDKAIRSLAGPKFSGNVLILE